jgi:hypothetical protein
MLACVKLTDSVLNSPIFSISQTHDMRTISLFVMGSPYANFSAIPARLHTGSPYAYGDPHMQNFYTYGDTKLNFPYAHNFIMHTGSD